MIDPFYQTCTRTLNTQDIPDILSVLHAHDNIGKVPYAAMENEISLFEQRYFTNPLIRIVGYFEDGRLISFLIQHMSNRIAAWHMTLLSTISQHRWDYKKNGLEYCWANAMDFAEKQRVFRVYWALPEAWARSQQRTVKTSDVWPRYDIYIEDIVPPQERPKKEEHDLAFGTKLKPHTITIKSGLLKNEYRHFN